MKSKMVLLASSLLVAQIATAQMMGNGNKQHGSTQPGTGGMTGGTGGMTGGPGGNMNGAGAMGGAMGNALTVGSDGVAYTLRATTAADTTISLEVVAIRPSGTVAWATKVDGGMTRVALSGGLLLVASGGDDDMGMTGGTGTTPVAETSQLVALSTASGTIQWNLALDGFAIALEPFTNGTYVSVARANTTATGMMNGGSPGTHGMSRSVVAVDNTGKVIWKLDLN